MTTVKPFICACLGALCLALAPVAASAEPFTITAALTGDVRVDNPDYLFVNVTVKGDTTSNVTYWTVQLDSPQQPGMTLAAFGFNLLGGAFADYTFSAVSPTPWSFENRNGIPGGGGADFLAEAKDPPGAKNDVRAGTPLLFTLTYNRGPFSEAMFLGAPLSTGTAIPNPGAQVGAYLMSLNSSGCAGRCQSTGFASGNYAVQPRATVPEPGSLALVGLGSTLFIRRRRPVLA